MKNNRKITVIGSHLCPDTLYALNQLAEASTEICFKNISASLEDLKVYLGLRDSEAMYQPVKESGGIGIPCFLLPDGKITMDLKKVLGHISR